jgi:hypothetical protein
LRRDDKGKQPYVLNLQHIAEASFFSIVLVPAFAGTAALFSVAVPAT